MSLTKAGTRIFHELASTVGSSRKQAGSWFGSFAQTVLRDYAEELLELGGATNWHKKWPKLDDEQIADRIVRSAVRQSTMAGAATGITTTAAFAATFGTPAGLAALPAAVSTLGAEILYTTRVQLRLVYDLATLYGYPIDPNDPEDLYKAFALANGVKVSVQDIDDDDGKGTTLDSVKAHLRALTAKQGGANRRIALNVLGPQIGRQIVLRALFRVGVPIVGVGASAAWNAYTTANLGSVARQELKALAELHKAGLGLGASLGTDKATTRAAIEACLCLATSDGNFGLRERELVDTVVRAIGPEAVDLERLEAGVTLSPDAVEARLAKVKDEAVRKAIAECLALVAACDGVVTYAESGLLMAFGRALKVPGDMEALRRRAEAFRRAATPADKLRTWLTERWESLPSLRKSQPA